MKIKKVLVLLLLITFSFSFAFVAACNFWNGDSISEESGLDNGQDSDIVFDEDFPGFEGEDEVPDDGFEDEVPDEDESLPDDENAPNEDETIPGDDEKLPDDENLPGEDEGSSDDETIPDEDESLPGKDENLPGGDENIEDDNSHTEIYQIFDYDDLNQLSEVVANDENIVIELKNDIDCNYNYINIIGDLNNPFSGEFNGNGFTISNISFSSYNSLNSNNFIGLFGVVENAKISNINFENCMFDIQGSNIHVGLICKTNGNVELENISLRNGSYTIIGDNIIFGGIVAEDLITSQDKRNNLSFENNMVTIESNGGNCYFGACFGKTQYSNGEISNLIINNNMIYIYDYNFGQLNIGFIIGELFADTESFSLDVVSISNNIFEVEDLECSNISRYIGNVVGINRYQISLNQLSYVGNYFLYNFNEL